MTGNLFAMSEAALDAAVEAYYDMLYERAFSGTEPECSNCRYYWDGLCDKLGGRLTNEELDDYTPIAKDPDDYCDEHEFKEE